jgi:hypothetical protein
MLHTKRMTRKNRARITYQWTVLGQSIQLTANQIALLGVIGSLLVYLAVRQPSVQATVESGLITSALVVLLPLVNRTLQFYALRYRRLRWVTVGISTLTVLAVAYPASAQFFNSLEASVTEVVTASGSGIDPGVIGGIFTMFRVLIVLAFVAGVVGMLVQAFRGGDWQPIASMVGIGLAFVIGVEIITRLMLGGAGGAGGGGNPAGV